jgi:peptidoglycan/xylan/chitin deacetylase (PgdA/CDA1 family)
MRIAISFDYDSPAGYRESFHLKDCSPTADLDGAEALLRVLSKYGVHATFGVVGKVGLPGKPPDHCPDQIRAIHAAGHEIASHSMYHRFIPPMRDKELLEDSLASRRALETCTGDRVTGFIPPFNRPMQFPRRGAVSVSEFLGLHGRGRGRQTVESMLRILHQAGFGWSRVSFSNKLKLVLRRCGFARGQGPAQPFLHQGVVAIPLHVTGFGDAARSLVDRLADTGLTVTLYGHPNQALEDNDQGARALGAFLEYTASGRLRNRVSFCTMAQVAELTRTVSAVA